MFYDTTASNTAVCVQSFGTVQTVSAGTFTLVLPGNGMGSSILALTA